MEFSDKIFSLSVEKANQIIFMHDFSSFGQNFEKLELFPGTTMQAKENPEIMNI